MEPTEVDQLDQEMAPETSRLRRAALIVLVAVLSVALLGGGSWYALAYLVSRPSPPPDPQLVGTWTFTDIRMAPGAGESPGVADNAVLVITPDGTYTLDTTDILKGTSGTSGNVRVVQGNKLEFYSATFPFGFSTKRVARGLAYKIEGDTLTIDEARQGDVFQRVADVVGPTGRAGVPQQPQAGPQTAAKAPTVSGKDATRILGTWNAPAPTNPAEPWDVSYTFNRNGTFTHVVASPADRKGTAQVGARYALTAAGDQPAIVLDYGSGILKTLGYGFKGNNALVLDGTTFTRGRQ